MIGETSVPTVELFDSPDEGLILSIASATSSTSLQQPPQTQPTPPASQTEPEQLQAESEEPIELVVTGEQDSYKVPDASTATRTDTPLRDIPQAIQVIPQQVIKDQGVTRIEDALRNAVGVSQGVDITSGARNYTIRGFDSRLLRNGFSQPSSGGGSVTPVQLPYNIERVEVLRGPDSVLYGSGEPGGTVNFVTKQPLSNPYYAAEFTAGQFSLYQPSIDLSGPLNEDKRLLYRFNSVYQNYGSFIDFVNGEAIGIAPVISYRIGDDTTLKFEYEYTYEERVAFSGLPKGPVLFELPISRNYNYPDVRGYSANQELTLTLNHEFNDNLSLRTALGGRFFDAIDRSVNTNFDLETNQANQFYGEIPSNSRDYFWQTGLTAKFNTGSIQHQLLAGVDVTNSNSHDSGRYIGSATTDIFNPVYDQSFGSEAFFSFDRDFQSNAVGIYLQDQVTLLPNLKLLVGGRYDFAQNDSQSIFIDNEVGTRNEFSNSADNEAFSPRVGIVYQPIEPISLYANFNRSFVPNNALTRTGELIEPTRGTQYEVGIKTEFGKLAANLAVYQITKTNILREDPLDSNFSIPVGEVRSRGIEFDIGGEILPGWNIIASTFLNESIVTVGDESNPEGETLENSPKQGASLWTTYQIQGGDLQGLGFGFGLFYVGDRETTIPNDFVLPSYVRADAALFYRQDNWDMQLNFQNLFETRYYEGGRDIQPGAPFSVQGTVSVRF